MRQFLLGLSFSVVFIVGCAVGTMQGSQVAEAQAEAPADGQAAQVGVQRWEQYCEDPEGGSMAGKNKLLGQYNDHMRKAGSEGWKLQHIVLVRGKYAICYTRPGR